MLPLALALAAVVVAAPHDEDAERLRVQRLAGVEGLLPAPTSAADDAPVAAPVAASGTASDGAGIVEVVLPAGPGGTGTPYAEVFEYRLPSDHEPGDAPRPLVVAYHGYSNSASSVAKLSTLDEECEARGWIYMSVTGVADQVFGTPVAQDNVEAAIEWMADEFAVDVDRIYMVGFSMGAGVVANFAARHRDPDGVVVAALGLVSSSLDWTMSYEQGGPGLRAVMESELNFGAPPSAAPFAYRRSSALHFDPETYPLYPGELLPLESMARNLGSTPTYVTWDQTDNVPLVKAQNPRLVDLLEELGGTVEVKVAQLTLDPETGFPAPHSWYVLKEKKLFDFFEQHRAKRRPLRVDALVDRPSRVSFVEVVPWAADDFGRLRASASGGALELLDADGVADAHVVVSDVSADTTPGALGLVTAGNVDRRALTVTLSRWSTLPDHAVDADGGYLAGTSPAPDDTSIGVPVPGDTTATFDVVDVPGWSARLDAPPAAPPGADVAFTLDGTPRATAAWLVVGPLEAPVPARAGEGLAFSVPPHAPNVVVPVPLVGGAGSVVVTLPTTPSLVGAPLRAQAALVDAGGTLVEVSNAQRIDPIP